MSKEIETPLIEAMMLLEMMLDPNHVYQANDMTWAVHSLVQQAWQRAAGHDEETPMPSETSELLAKIRADSAIENAMANRRLS